MPMPLCHMLPEPAHAIQAVEHGGAMDQTP
jgi:hypothetical protein